MTTGTTELWAFALQYDFELDDFQVRACEELEAGRGVLVAAPTGSGKTLVGEFAVHLALASGRKCFYTAPIKALSNQKFHELVERHGADKVGLLTGDRTVNGEAPVVVMTTEVLRNMLYAGSRTLAGLAYVVMDEVHYLADRERGAVWEEVIIHLPESVTVVSLSATVSNAEEFGEWLAEVRGDTATIVEERRPVPLHQHVAAGRQLYPLFAPGSGSTKVNRDLVRLGQDDWASSRLMRDRRSPRKGHRGSSKNPRQVGNGRRVWIPSRPQVVDRLDRERMLPAIVFVFSRVGCDAAVTQCLTAGVRLTSPDELDRIQQLAESALRDLPDEDREVLGYDAFLDGLSRGVAAHHAGMLPAFKHVVEDLFVRGLCKVVFATETLALGINMPARTVVIEKLTKWNGETHADVTAGEYTQLTGRAGRRGLDTEGHAVVLWQRGIDPAEVAGLASTRTYPLRSSFRPSYNMAVNLVERYGQDRARELLEQSFAQFQADRSVVGLARQLQKAEDAIGGYAEAATCHLGDFLEYADLRRQVSDVEREASRARRSNHKREFNKAKAKIADLRRELRAHPCHACPDREDHARWGERWAKLDRDAATLRRRIDRRTNTVARQFDRVVDVLLSLGYLEPSDDGVAVTDDGQRLRRLYSGMDLLAAEALRLGLFDGLGPSALAAVVSVLSYEARRPDDASAPRLPGGEVPAAIESIVRLWGQLDTLEKDHHLDFLRQPDAGLAWVAYRWAEGDDLDEVLHGTELAAGDFVRWMRLLVDLTGQVADAAEGTPLRKIAREAVDAMRRGVVADTDIE